MEAKLAVVHYLNQFFGGIGGEEHADTGVEVREGPIGPGRLLDQELGDQGGVVSTIICGDNYAAEDWEQALPDIQNALETIKPDVVVAGPAFDSGRYGLACGQVCIAAKQLGIATVTAMHPESVGILMHRRELVAVPTSRNPGEMAAIMKNVVRLAIKVGRGEELGSAAEEGYIPRGFRRLVYHDKVGYERALDMLTARIEGKPFQSEINLSHYERVEPAPPVADLSNATVAFVVSTGMVPKGNPDRVPAARAVEAPRYSIEDIEGLDVDEWVSAHGGFNTEILNTVDPNYGLPLKALRILEKKGVIKKIHPFFYSTVGNQTAINPSKEMGEQIARDLKTAGVDVVLEVAG